MFEVDITNQLYTFFENAEDIFGVSGNRILNDVRPYSRLSAAECQKAVSAYFSHPDDFEVINTAFQSIFRGESTTYEARMRAGGSDFIWCKLDVTPITEENGTVKMIGVITDISDHKSRRDHLEDEILRDTFTGLYSKNGSLEKIRQLLKKNPDRKYTLILADIDNFKLFNDAFGHAEGDKIIKAVTNTYSAAFRQNDIVGRFGGDEFILFISDIPNADWLQPRLRHLVKGNAECYPWSASVGISLYPQDAVSLDALFQMADNALYRSKVKKGHYTFSSECK